MRLDSLTTTSAIIAALKQWPPLDTSSWPSICSLTLTLKQAVWSGAWRFALDERQAKKTFGVFMNRLNRTVYGNAVKRHGKRLRVIMVVEGGFERRGRIHPEKRGLEKRLHIHAAI